MIFSSIWAERVPSGRMVSLRSMCVPSSIELNYKHQKDPLHCFKVQLHWSADHIAHKKKSYQFLRWHFFY